MRKPLIILGAIGFILLVVYYTKIKFTNQNPKFDNPNRELKKLVETDVIKDGDLIFQTSLSDQSKAIQLATKSKYSHCGIIYKNGNKCYVFEAVQPVKSTPLDTWIARGKDKHYVIKRLKNADEVITASNLIKMKKVGKQLIGKNYDLTFEWSDDKIYCSELIWKVYERGTGIQIGKLENLRDFDLTNAVVKRKMLERYRDKIPMDEIVISPAALFSSELLITVQAN